MIDPRIYLASRSPRRRELLAQVGVRFDLLLFRLPPRDDAEVSEDWLPGETPEAYVQRLGASRLQFLALAEIGGESHHFALVSILQPLEDDGGIETTGIGQYYFFDVAHFCSLVSFQLNRLAVNPAQQQIFHQCFLHMQPILGFVPDHGLRTINDFGRHFFITMRWQAMHE